MCYECVQLKYETFSRCGSSSPDNAEFVQYSLLFCRVRRRNVQSFITHVYSYCFAYFFKKPFVCRMRFSLPLPSCFAQGPYDLYSTRLSDNRRALSNIRWVRWRKWISLALLSVAGALSIRYRSCVYACARILSPALFIVTVTAKYFMVFVFPFQSLKFLCSNHMMLLWLFFARLPLGPGAKKDGCFRRLIFCGYVFPRTVNETKKAIILCIS